MGKEKWEQRRKQKEEDRKGRERKRKLKTFISVTVFLLVLGGGIAGVWWYTASAPETPSEDIISKNGIHWHPHLTIVIEGKEQEIPANIGIGVRHYPIHTHDATGELHLEFEGIVTRDDITVRKFFEIWGKPFSSSCILEHCAKDQKTVKLFVNGKENTEFENYVMRDKDELEIKYE